MEPLEYFYKMLRWQGKFRQVNLEESTAEFGSYYAPLPTLHSILHVLGGIESPDQVLKYALLLIHYGT